jgi:acyl-coenzyme A synthetase/AMP-(fatty) acid ligase
MAYAAAAAELYELSNLDRMTNIAPLHFDQSTFELYAAPLVGATVIVVPDPVLRFPASVADLIEAQRATVWYSVPHLLVQLTTRGVLERRDLTSLRWILVGGEAFPPGQLAELMEQIPSAQVSNVYGPAEVNQCTHHHVVEPPSGAEPVPIGRPWAAAEVRLVEPGSAGTVDPDRTIAAGDVGLVIVRTSTMMSGYWGREDLTAAAVVEQTDGGTLRRWYVTGDLAVHNAAGDLVFVGRVDNQIKLRGHRIELEAVDAAILEVDGVVAGTAVVDRPTGEEDRLVALIEIDPAFDPPDVSAAVRDELRRKLPRYSVPAEIRVVGRLPRTSTGKVDRVASAGLVRP